MMRGLLRLPALLSLAGTLLAQGGAGALTQDDIEYFRHILLSVTNLSENPNDLARKEQAYVGQFGFSQAEAKIFHAVAEEFRAGLLQLKNAATPIVAGKDWKISDADRARMNELAVQRDQLVVRLATRLLNDVGPAAAQRMRLLKSRPR